MSPSEGQSLEELCGGNRKMYEALKALGLFSEPTRIAEKLEHFVEKARETEKGSQTPATEARYLYRIIMRLALYYARHDILKQYAAEENYFLKDKVYEILINETENAVDIAQRYYKRK